MKDIVTGGQIWGGRVEGRDMRWKGNGGRDMKGRVERCGQRG